MTSLPQGLRRTWNVLDGLWVNRRKHVREIPVHRSMAPGRSRRKGGDDHGPGCRTRCRLGRTPDGRDATCYTLESERLRACITDYGGRLAALEVGQAAGGFVHAVLGFDDFASCIDACRGGIYRQSAGFAFEPQGFPNAPNQKDFPSVVLRANGIYRRRIGYAFSVPKP